MLSKLGSHARHNVVAYLALFFALSGTAAAAEQLMRHGDPAGGDLTGFYPGPTISPNAVGTNEVDGSLTGTDVSDAGGGTLMGADILESSLGKVGDADTLDGQNSAAFLGATAKAADADQLDGNDSTDFLGATAKAADANKLDGKNSTAYARLGGGVRDDGTVFQGSGFDVLKLSTGAYQVSFPDGTFTGAESPLPGGCHWPIVSVTPFTQAGVARIATIFQVECRLDGSGGFKVAIFDHNGAPQDGFFEFLAL